MMSRALVHELQVHQIDWKCRTRNFSAQGAPDATEKWKPPHTGKGTACYLGAPDTMDATQRVEQAGKSGNLPVQPR